MTVLTHYTTNWIDLANITVKNTLAYCKKHGYSFIDSVTTPYPRYTGIEKLKMYEDLKSGDVGFFLDCDAIITNHKFKIEDFIDDEHDFFVCEGLNMGVFIIRQSEWSDKFINWLIADTITGQSNCEQDAIQRYLSLYPNDEKIKVVPHPAFNSWRSELYPEITQPQTEEQGQWIEGKSFVLHLPGMNVERRIEIFNQTPIVL